MGLRQVGLHHDLGLARIGHVDGGEILRRALVREPQDAAAVGRDLDRHAFAHAAEAVEHVVADELEVPGDRTAVADRALAGAAFFAAGFLAAAFFAGFAGFLATAFFAAFFATFFFAPFIPLSMLEIMHLPRPQPVGRLACVRRR